MTKEYKKSKYLKLTHREHILKRPDTYIGSIESEEMDMYVVENCDLSNIKIVKKKVKNNPGFIKIFDEIITNASDHSIRTGKVKSIKISIGDNRIIVENDGPSIEIAIHPEEGVYNQELIFSNLLTGENYDDENVRELAGKNGYGSKITNAFSKKFKVECCDSKQLYKQWTKENMSIIEKPEVSDVKDTNSFTRITYYPDFKLFGMESITEDIRSIMYKRCLDIAAYLPNVRISLDGKTLPIKKMQDYMKMHLEPDADFFYETTENGWQIGVAKSTCYNFESTSIVNGVTTFRGGTHVNHVALQLSKAISDKFPKSVKANWTDVKNKLFLFLVCKIPNPSFDTQTKETLTNRMTADIINGSELSDNTIKKIMKSDIVKSILDEIELREKLSLKRLGSGKKSKNLKLEKLMDASKAGTKDSDKCYIFLTEGDSASSMCIAGIGAIPDGRQYNGCFPLKGKLLNVRGASVTKLKENNEIKNLVEILGLEFGKKYTDTSELRYGRTVLFCDADSDGLHIKALLMNLFENFWPELLKMDFLYEFITPILKAKRGSDIKSFYTEIEYKNWVDSGKSNGYKIKYYKGLGTSTPIEAKAYFKDLNKHLLPFMWDTDKNTDDIDMVFNDKRVEDRKKWMLTTTPKDVIKIKQTNISSFIHDEVITFSLADTIRSIPNIYDGLKPSQRKILYTCIDNNITNEIPVSSLAGLVKTKSNYHHGETSLEQGIINLSQDYVGSNNLNILVPEGQFGSRLQGGRDAASPRYVHTMLSTITKFIFRPEDNDILTNLNEDGYIIEPETYKPIIPMILVNGSEGIGTGWSCNIPMYNPKDIIRVVENKLNKKRSNRIHPWYKGFIGEVIELDNNNYITRGIFERKNSTTLHITELPIGMWTQTYITYLNRLIDDKFIKGFDDNSNEENVNITIDMPRESMMEINTDELLIKKFKLDSNIYTSNMNLFVDGKIVKFDSVMDIIDSFYVKRFEDYKIRKEFQLSKLITEQNKLENIVKFIKLVISNQLLINNRKKDDIIKDMTKHKLMKIDDTYNYLLNMSIYSLTKEKVDELNLLLKKKINEHKELKKTTIDELWLKDLSELKAKIKI